MVILYFFVEIFLKINKKRNNHIKREKRSTDKRFFQLLFSFFNFTRKKKKLVFLYFQLLIY